jgi:hypothetical protein
MNEMARELWRQTGSVAADLPRFLTAPLYRSWHLRWGATDAELAATMPGDDLLPHSQFRPTRAITIDAPPAAVWPWLVQVGCGRAGFYSNDLLDNFARPSLREISPDLQHLEVGQWVSMSPAPSERTAFKVDSFVPNEWLLWRKPDSTWSWVLRDLRDGRTRLVARVHALYDWSRPANGVFGMVLMEFGDFAMMRRMLLGIKQRAEGTSRAADSTLAS